jgi:hypothetical protein
MSFHVPTLQGKATPAQAKAHRASVLAMSEADARKVLIKLGEPVQQGLGTAKNTLLLHVDRNLSKVGQLIKQTSAEGGKKIQAARPKSVLKYVLGGILAIWLVKKVF